MSHFKGGEILLMIIASLFTILTMYLLLIRLRRAERLFVAKARGRWVEELPLLADAVAAAGATGCCLSLLWTKVDLGKTSK